MVVCCTPDSPRALPAADLAAQVEALGGTAVVVPDVGEALQRALESAAAEDAVMVTGSLYTVGAARALPPTSALSRGWTVRPWWAPRRRPPLDCCTGRPRSSSRVGSVAPSVRRHEPDLRHVQARRRRAGPVGEIVARLERKGLTLVAAELRHVDNALAEEHYAEHADKPFFGELVAFLTRSPVFAMVVEGPADNTFSLVRMLVGATKVDDAQPGTIRGDLATTTTENLVHASDGPESAAREIALWFPDRA